MRLLPPTHQGTTAALRAAYPFVVQGAVSERGAYVGRDLLGDTFCFDPWELYAAGVITGPNAIVIGQIGRGKSSLIKTLLWREQTFGCRAWVIDPKGEYGPLARACGVRPVVLRPGGEQRLNPLEPPTSSCGREFAPVSARRPARDEGRRRPLELLGAIVASALRRPLRPGERTACELALDAARRAAEQNGVATLPSVVNALLQPSVADAARIYTSAATLADDGREVALELRRLVEGDLRGMFDGPTTPGLDLDAPLVVLDLSSVYGSSALGLVITCAAAWMQASTVSHPDRRQFLVVDEAWALLSDVAIARWLQASFKLSRSLGTANIAVLHRVSDLAAAGDSGSEQVRLAQGLLADSETRIVYGQPPGEVAAARELLGLSNREAELLPRLPRGVALWKIAAHTFLVQHRLGPLERALVETDARMADQNMDSGVNDLPSNTIFGSTPRTCPDSVA